MEITLNSQQAEGLEKVIAWYKGRGEGFTADVFRWFGYAGTGKTFTAARIPEALGLNRVVFGTYTGKAASVLRRSLNSYGVSAPVTTIHSAIYLPTTSAEARKALEDAQAELETLLALKSAVEGEPDAETANGFLTMAGWADAVEFAGALSEVSESIPALEANARRLRFELNPDSEWAQADLIILDEVSMVNAKLAADIEYFGVPILVLGDPAQLPPVEGGGYYTDATPDHLLTLIQRQALDSPVTALATRVRESADSQLGLREWDQDARSLRAAMDADIVLVWTNKRRWSVINAIRAKLARPAGTPVPGDMVMCLTNNKDMGVFNGEIFEVLSTVAGTLGPTLTVRTETGLTRDLPVYAEGFTGQDAQVSAKNSGLGMKGNRILATFAQAITVHKSQGSEWDHVYVFNETPGMLAMTAKREGLEAAREQGRRWLYTAVTRAKVRVSIARPS